MKLFHRFAQTTLWLASGSLICFAVVVSPSHKKTPAHKVKGPIADGVEFNRDIRGILSNKCLECHGQDPKAVRANLKLNSRESATAKLADGAIAIVPGNPDQSELIRRIDSKDPDVQMPPPDSNKVLSDEDRAILRQWIEEGAVYKPHWGFQKPIRYAPPPVSNPAWVRNPIDAFVMAKLDRHHLKPSPEADKATLLRRVSLDIDGLPPTPAELNAFLADKSPDAYEKVVDRLLASPRYAERMAMNWMDYARYADSNGYQSDWERFQWSWRDWVLQAFNSNMPYDQFIIKQLAGDMLPNPTLDDIIATGFNRNHRINTEGGVIPEEWRTENVIDRVSTTTTVFMGLTAGCARCHDHKYDPITQDDFYSLYAYFNNVPETGSGVEQPVDHPPYIKAPPVALRSEYASLKSKVAWCDGQLTTLAVANEDKAQTWKPIDPPIPDSVRTATLARYAFTETPSVVAGTAPVPKIVGDVKFEPGRFSGAVQTTDKSYLDLGNVGDFSGDKPFSYAVWIKPNDANGSPISRMDSPHAYRGWDLYLADGVPACHFISKWPDNALKIRSNKPLPMGQWSHIAVTYDGSRKAKGMAMYVNGVAVPVTVEADSLTGPTNAGVTAKVGRRTGSDDYNGLTDDLQLFSRQLTAAEVAAISGGAAAHGLLAIPLDQRSIDQRRDLSRLYCEAEVPEYAKLKTERASVEKQFEKVDAKVPDVMIMREMKTPRVAHILIRGQYDHPGPVVHPHVPAALGSLPPGAPDNRLGLAEWIASKDNPLTARVEVNRLWERLFGSGIVATADDFGTRADFPTHPELLDWLATEFMRLNWNMKAMLKEMVMSSTYRQSSAITPQLYREDPLNKLLARGPRFRLPAEVIRDQVMYVSGMLTEKLGGPSVRPYQPDGIWDDVSVYGNLHNYKHDIGPNLHRRSLYTFWKRTGAPPEMTLFDVPGREVCTVLRARTDTPLQALTLLNDETYIEASRALAQKAIKEGPKTEKGRLDYMFRSIEARIPTDAELRILMKGYQERLKHYEGDIKDADHLLSIGDWPLMDNPDIPSLAAYTTVASTILNLDETITKE